MKGTDTIVLMNSIDYSKLTISLVLAFGLVVDGDYLFRVVINDAEARFLTQEEVFELTRRDDVFTIDIDRRTDTRRWHERYVNKDRRNE